MIIRYDEFPKHKYICDDGWIDTDSLDDIEADDEPIKNEKDN